MTEIDGSPEIFHIATELQRMGHIGTVQTIQIEFDIIPEVKKKELSTVFNESLGIGQFKSDMIILESLSDRDLFQLIGTLHYIRKIFGDLSLIDAITALIEIVFMQENYFIVVSYLPRTGNLELISTSDSQLYFELLKYVKTKWIMSRTFIK